jgi:hypothetical protein
MGSSGRAFHNRCATAANESLTFTLPKEVNLFAEGDPEKAKAAMYAAAQKSLDAIYGHKRYTAVAPIHTRNENAYSGHRDHPDRSIVITGIGAS